MTKLVAFALFVATVVAANYALATWGIVPVPLSALEALTGIGPGLTAPAGVYFAGLGFGLRDALHEAGGRRWVLAAIAVGAVVSYVLEDAVTIPGGLVPIAVASAAAFALAELADLAVYSPLREHDWPTAVALSNVAGAVVDSALFLWLAFGSLEHLAGNVVGKLAMVAVALPIVWEARRRAVPSPRVRAGRP